MDKLIRWCLCEMSEVGLVCKIFYKNKPLTARNKGFRTLSLEYGITILLKEKL